MAKSDLLTQIEVGANDKDSDLPTVLRLCIQLGGQTGSNQLREWASRELKGYAGLPNDDLPSYRIVGGAVKADAVMGINRVQGMSVSSFSIPDFARNDITTDVRFPHAIAQIVGMLETADKSNESMLTMTHPKAAWS